MQPASCFSMFQTVLECIILIYILFYLTYNIFLLSCQHIFLTHLILIEDRQIHSVKAPVSETIARQAIPAESTDEVASNLDLVAADHLT